MPIRLAFVGDTQRILPIERLARPRETNDVGRHRIAEAILDEQVDAIVHLGDVVGSASGWIRFDRDYPPSALSSKPFHVCRGNHDCGGFWFGSPDEFKRRFPKAVAQLQVLELGLLRLILLDTNRGAMSQHQWMNLQERFVSALTEADRDPSVEHVVVAGHHPPFTNARWHSPSRAVLEAFVPPFMECPKTRAFLSGHVHGYECFSIEDRYFVVTGGGGGARFSHLHGTKRRMGSDVDLRDPHPLHYVVMEASRSTVTFSARAHAEQTSTWIELDRQMLQRQPHR